MAVDSIAHSLANPRTSQSPQQAENNITSNNAISSATHPVSSSSGTMPSQLPGPVSNSTGATIAVSGSSSSASTRYLAICITTSGIYKTLIELDVTNIKSDATLFQAMKTSYHKARGYKSRLTSLFKPVSVEFIHVSRLLHHPAYEYSHSHSSASGTSAAASFPYATDQKACHPSIPANTTSPRNLSGHSLQCRLRYSYTIFNTAMMI